MNNLFVGTSEQFKDEFQALCDKYGYDQWFYAISEHLAEEEDVFSGHHSEITEGFIEYLEEVSEDLREEIDNQK